MASLAILLLGIGVLWRGIGVAASRWFFFVSVTAAVWLGASAGMFASSSASTAIVWARVAHLFGALIPAAVFHFATRLDGRGTYRIRLAIFWTGCAAIAGTGLFTNILISSVRRFSWGFYPVASPFGGLFVVFLSATIISAIYVFWTMYRRAEGRERERAGALLLAIVLGSMGVFDLCPAAGINLQPVGYIAALAFVIVAATAVWRFELGEITPEYAAGQILETIKSAVIVSDMSGNIRVVNRGAEQLLGYSAQSLKNMHLRKILDAEEDRTTGQLVHTSGVLEHPMAWRTADGSRIDVLAASSFLRSEEGTPEGVVYVGSDYTERKRAEEELRRSEARYRLLFERNLAGVFRSAADGTVLDCNDACARIFGFATRDQFIATDASEFYFEPGDRERLIEVLREQKQLTNMELRLRRRDGSPVWVLENVTLLDGDVLEGTIFDITERKYVQEQMEYQAYHDHLTNLPNRLLFRDRIGMALAHARRKSRKAAVMFLDLDQFKHVNDTLGHTVGDRLLQVIGSRLAGCVRAEDTVARMGGDEFTILLADLNDPSGASSVAQKVLDSVRDPVVVDEHELRMTTSIGIALFPDDGDDVETVLQFADRAMYRAKELGRDNYQFASPVRLEIASDGRGAMARGLRQAMERRELAIHYQPIVDLTTRRIIAAESLVRWNHPELGLLPAEKFLPLAAEMGLMSRIGGWVLRSACAQGRIWQEAGHEGLRIAVNLSLAEFEDPRMLSSLGEILSDTRLPASRLELEMPESVAMHSPDLALAVLASLKEQGIRVSVDDFGTGYSSLSHLQRFPIGGIKIDRQLVHDLARNETAMISAVISMARALSLRVVAEGVETEEQLALLRAEHCDAAQGFLFSAPVPAAEFEKLLGGHPEQHAPSARPRVTME